MLAASRLSLLEMDLIAYNSAISACRTGAQALALMAEMAEDAHAPDAVTYGAAITACAKGEDWQQALALLAGMEMLHVVPDRTVLNAAISACSACAEWSWALAVMRAMHSRQMAPDDITYGAASDACERGEQRLRALKLDALGLPTGRKHGQASEAVRRSAATRSAAPTALPPSLHVCIVQGDEEGFRGWNLERGCKHNRWDTLLEGSLKCLAMDGQWLRDVCVSVFAGADVLHITGDVQSLAMPVAGMRDDGRPMYEPATLESWAEMLWRARGQDLPGLRWRLSLDAPCSKEEAQAALLANFGEALAGAPDGSAVLAFTPSRAGGTYDELKAKGQGKRPRPRQVLVLLGGAHGFDGNDDAGGPGLFEEVMSRCCDRFGKAAVASVSLCENAAREAKFPLAKVAAFVSVEHARGSFVQVLAGLEAA